MQNQWRCTAVLIALSTGTVLNAQNITGSILGQVADPSGLPIPGAIIIVKSTETGITATTVTDSSGTYSIPNLLASTYQVTARKDGFQTLTVRGIQLLSAQTLRQDVNLQVGAVQQTVEVVAKAIVIRTDSQTVGRSVGRRSASALAL